MANLKSKSIQQHIALVGNETLLGREVKEVLEASTLNLELELFAASGEGNFGEEEGEAVYLRPLDEIGVGSDGIIILAGSETGSEKAYALAKAGEAKPLLIDCTGALDHLPAARISAPLIRDEAAGPERWLHVVAHPAAVALALLLTRLSGKIRTVLVEVFEPASQQGKSGIAELQQQTANLLSFKALEKQVYDSQVSFNLLPAYGREARVKLEQVEQRIEKHLASLLSASKVPMPSLRLVQAPVFHGYSFSIWLEFEETISTQAVAETLASAQIEIRSAEEEIPDNVGVAGQSGVIVGDIRRDRNHPRAIWLWAVADNLRMTADNVLALLSSRSERVV